MLDRNLKLEVALENAWVVLSKLFPFSGYIREPRKVGYFEMVRYVAKWSSLDAKVLDFGAGPCDKTALFSLVGMQITAVDDMQDAWHKLNRNREKILTFAKDVGIEYVFPTETGEFSVPDKQYDVLMSHDVLEHFHASPRVTLNNLLKYVRPEGIMVITVPNAANLRKRVHLLFGKTNYNRFEYYYWYPGLWRGHVREYVRNDLILLNRYLGLELLELSTYHLQLDVLPAWARPLFTSLTHLFPGFRDSWVLVSRKPEDWNPKFTPNSDQFEKAFGDQYFDYSNSDFDWEE